MLMRSWIWKEVLRGKNVNISFNELFKIYLAGFSIRFLAPVITLGDEIFQTYALKERNSLSWLKGAASVVVERILEWTVNLVVIFFGLLFFLSMIGLPPQNLLIIFGGLFVIFAFGIFFFYFKTFKKESIAKAIGKVFNHQLDSRPLEIEKEIFDFFNLKKIRMWKIFFLSFLRVVMTYLRTWLLIIFLGKSIGGLPALSILGFNFLAAMIPIPTALGSHEAIQTFTFNSLGLGAPAATAFAMIIRGADLIFALIGLIILFGLGIKFFKKIFKNDQPI